jgi:hypothetical protein
VAEMLRRPAPWRGAMEIGRLNEAIGLRERVNKHYLSDDVRKLGTRTLRSLSTRSNTNSSRLPEEQASARRVAAKPADQK